MAYLLNPLALTFCAVALHTLAMSPSVASDTAEGEQQERTVGGVEINIDTAPSTAALLSTSTLAQTASYFQSQFCAGTVIAPRGVLSAAHCLSSNNGELASAQDLVVLSSTAYLTLASSILYAFAQSIDHAQLCKATMALLSVFIQ